MILKIFASLVLSLTTFAAAFQYGGIKHDITSQIGTASPIIMNAASTQVQRITGSTAQTIRLPDATTLRSGYWYTLVNENSSAVTVQNSSSFTLGTLSGGSAASPTYATLYITSNATSGGPWTFQKDQSAGLSPSGVTPGSYTNANITVDTNGIVTAASNGSSSTSVVDAAIYLDTPNGHGATNTKIITFASTKKNTGGSYLSYTSDSTNGDKITALQNGMYAFCAGAGFGGAAIGSIAVTVNDSAMTTNAGTPLTYAQGLRNLYVGQSFNDVGQACDVSDLSAGDIIRAHDDGNNSLTSSAGYLYVVYLGPQSGNEFYVDNPIGQGSTNTLVRTYTASAASVRKNTGSAYTFTQSSTNGDLVTINSTGTYWVCRTDMNITSNTSYYGGITVDDSALSTSIDSMTYAQGRRFISLIATNYFSQTGAACGPLYLASGSVVRAKDTTSKLGNATDSRGALKLIKLNSFDYAAYLDTPSGYGSVLTKFRKMTQIRSTSTTFGVGNSNIAGTSLMTYATGVYVGCMQDVHSTLPKTGVMLNPRLGTTNISTPLEYNDGFRGYRANAAGSSTSQHCAFDLMGPGGNIIFGGDAESSNTDAYINFSGARIN